MPKTSLLRKPGARHKLPKFGVTRRLGRLVLAFGILAVFIAVLTVILIPKGSAQGNSEKHESGFARKADKMLHLARKAKARDEAEQRSGLPARGKSRLEALSKTVGLQRKADGKVIIDVVVKLAGSSERELKEAGFAIGAKVGDMATLQVDIERLDDLASLPSVDKITAAVRRYPKNDRARKNVGIENFSAQRVVTQTGQGVVVAIIDTGIDFRHADFTVPGSGGQQTRIKALLDMTLYGAQVPDPGWNYVLPGQSAPIGHLYTEGDLNAALQLPKPANQNADSVKQRDKHGHGTHVAGTAAGNGLSSPNTGVYSGMAHESDLIIVKASRDNDGGGSFLTSDIINALQFVQQKAAELNKPFVINLSLGGHVGPHDGTTPDERAIDSLVNAAAGRAVCVAAGNEGESNIHARATVPAGGELTLDFNVDAGAQIVDLYQAQNDRFSVTVTSPDGVILGPVAYDPNGFSNPNPQASNQYLDLFNANDNKGDSDPSNDQPDIVLLFDSGAPTGLWKIKLQDADSNPNQDFDAWSEGDSVYFSSHVDNISHLVASPGTARAAITVGAFVTRSASFILGYPAPFTSPGPTADGRQKPDISAPGYYLYSPRSTDVPDPNFGTIGTGDDAPVDSTHYTGLAGTSMATPVTSGSVALMMQSDLTLSSELIKGAIRDSASPGYSSGWDRQFGHGKLNIAAAIQLGGGPRYKISGRVTGTNALLTLSGSQTGITGTDNQGNYEFRNLRAGGNYTVTPSVQSPLPWVFTPATHTFTNLSSNQTADFSAAVSTHTVSGRITDASGNGIAGISVRSFMSPAVITNANGDYVMPGLIHGSSQRIRAESQDYSFQPAEYSFFINQDQVCNFVAHPFYKISGRITDENGVGISDGWVSIVSATLISGAPTNSAGDYQIERLPGGIDYAVASQALNRSFTPESVVISNLSGNQTVNFARRPAIGTYNIGGRVLDANGVSVAGLRVNLGGDATGATITNSNGIYSFILARERNYTITPISSTKTFAPPSASFTNLDGNKTVDFVAQIAGGPSEIRFVSEHFTLIEGGASNFVTVVRLGNTDLVATVNYSTSDEAGLNNCNLTNTLIASARCDYAMLVGSITFGPGETSKTISIPIVHDAFQEGYEAFRIHLNGAVGATLSNDHKSASVEILDVWNSSRVNPVAEVEFFVRQHYADFLGRDPEPGGFHGWQVIINNCPPGNTSCDRVHVSGAFFQSPEFQQRGYFVYRFYPVALGRKPNFAEFIPDIARVSGFLTDVQLEAALVAFVNDFMNRPLFTATYNSLNNTQFVDTLLATAGVTHPSRDAWITALGNGTKTRAEVLREIAESTQVYSKYYNQAFVVMQYFGYLRRDPDAAYLNWIQELDNTGSARTMIHGFVNSPEYTFRFGP